MDTIRLIAVATLSMLAFAAQQGHQHQQVRSGAVQH